MVVEDNHFSAFERGDAVLGEHAHEIFAQKPLSSSGQFIGAGERVMPDCGGDFRFVVMFE